MAVSVFDAPSPYEHQPTGDELTCEDCGSHVDDCECPRCYGCMTVCGHTRPAQCLECCGEYEQEHGGQWFCSDRCESVNNERARADMEDDR